MIPFVNGYGNGYGNGKNAFATFDVQGVNWDEIFPLVDDVFEPILSPDEHSYENVKTKEHAVAKKAQNRGIKVKGMKL